jgi:hypothetical protein
MSKAEKISPVDPGTDVLAAVAEHFAGDGDFMAAGAAPIPSPAVVPTVRHALLTALGCDPRAGTLAYWEWEKIDALLRDSWAALDLVEGQNVELWVNDKERTRAEVVDRLRSARTAVVRPEPFMLRPWCRLSLVRTCRIPYVPVASVLHVWLSGRRPLGRVLDEMVIERGTDPWEVLRRADAVAGALPSPDGVADCADAVRVWMLGQTPQRYSPAAALLAAAETIGKGGRAELTEWATTTASADEAEALSV